MDFIFLCMWLFRVLCTLFITLTVREIIWKKSGLSIPGPWSVPFIGSLPFIGAKVHSSLTRMREKYGDIFQVTIGCQKVVVLCGTDTVQAALIDQPKIFSGRPRLHTFQIASEGKSLSFNSVSSKWKAHRRLAEQALKLASNLQPLILENMVVKEARNLVRDCVSACIEKTDGLDPEENILWSVAHVKYTLCYGNSHADSDFENIVKTVLKLIGCHNNGNMINFFPWAKFLFFFTFKRTHAICDNMLQLNKRKQQEHLCTYDESQCRDALDALIQLGLKKKCSLEKERVLNTVQEYIVAGLDIVYVTINWAVLYMATFPEMQERMRLEVDKVIGHERNPKEEDALQMPYTQAFVQEVLRHSGVVPFALPHCTMEDTYLRGIFIPKDSFILVNLYSISRDPSVWSDPDIFQPDRFLEMDGSPCYIKEGFSPYGLGNRKCIGEKISRMEIFLFITTLLQSAVIEKPSDCDKYDLDPTFGVVLRPHPFKVIFKPRTHYQIL